MRLVGSDFVEQTFVELDLRDEPMDAKSFVRCTFDRCQFPGVQLADVSFEDCDFEACDLANVALLGTRFHGVRFKASRLAGIDWTSAEQLLFDVRFEDCAMRFGRFSGMRLCRLKMTGCDARDTDFSRADLRRAVFDGTQLGHAAFDGAQLQHAALDAAFDVGFRPSEVRLSKTRINLELAFKILADMGLDVHSPDGG